MLSGVGTRGPHLPSKFKMPEVRHWSQFGPVTVWPMSAHAETPVSGVRLQLLRDHAWQDRGIKENTPRISEFTLCSPGITPVQKRY